VADDSKPSKRRPPRASRRKRRGHSSDGHDDAATLAAAHALASEAATTTKDGKRRKVKSVRQLDPEAFRQVDGMLGSFAQRRFGKLMPKVAEGFFGAASEDERKLPVLQQAFALYFVYGYRDGQGLRILDMFARFGLKLDREQQRVLAALQRTSFVVFALDRKNDANKQLQGRDLLRGVPMTALDRGVFDHLVPGDVIVAYMFPVGDLWRPLGMCTKVARAKANTLGKGLSQLAQQQGFSPPQLADRRPAQIFWTALRVAERNFSATA